MVLIIVELFNSFILLFRKNLEEHSVTFTNKSGFGVFHVVNRKTNYEFENVSITMIFSRGLLIEQAVQT